MPKGPKGEKRPADAVGAAVMVAKIATGEIEEDTDDGGKDRAAVELGRKGGRARGDNGLSGKKLVVDAYGPRVPIGGGALSGKDFFKVDRAGTLHARRIAKAVVVTGVASEALVGIVWFPGDTSARLMSIQAEGGRSIDTRPWQDLFDLTLEASGEHWTNATDLLEVARYGQFTETDRPWEKVWISPSAVNASIYLVNSEKLRVTT